MQRWSIQAPAGPITSVNQHVSLCSNSGSGGKVKEWRKFELCQEIDQGELLNNSCHEHDLPSKHKYTLQDQTVGMIWKIGSNTTEWGKQSTRMQGVEGSTEVGAIKSTWGCYTSIGMIQTLQQEEGD